MTKEKHPLFLSMEEVKLREKFLADVESKIPLYFWKLYDKDEPISTVQGKQKGSPIIVLPKKI